MKKIIITATAIIAFLCSCTTNNDSNTSEQTANETSSSNIPNFTRSFEGKLNNKFGIIMTLTNNSMVLSGTYSY